MAKSNVSCKGTNAFVGSSYHAVTWLNFSFPLSEALTPLTTPSHYTQGDCIVLMSLTLAPSWTIDL
jgi:hypothetical protein